MPLRGSSRVPTSPLPMRRRSNLWAVPSESRHRDTSHAGSCEEDNSHGIHCARCRISVSSSSVSTMGLPFMLLARLAPETISV